MDERTRQGAPLDKSPRASAFTPRRRAGTLLGARLPRLVELWRRAHGRRSDGSDLDDREIEAAGKALLSLQRGLTGDRRLAGVGYMDDAELFGAYLLYYWPVSYMQVSVALAERPCSPRSVLDLGCGPGPASAAILDAETSESRLDRLSLVDASRTALEFANAVLSTGPRAPGRLETSVIDLDSDADLPDGPFDLIVASHCLNELWRGKPDALERRRAFIERAALRLSTGGSILLIEPALLATCRDLIALRDALVSRQWRVIAPCPGSYSCPAFAAGPERSCHADSPWTPPQSMAALARRAGLDRSSIKFAYFFLEPPAEGRAHSAIDTSYGLRRVVSEPMLNKAGRLRYVLCGDGGLETVSAKADDPDAMAKGFMELRRGDLVRPRDLESRPGGGKGFHPGSDLGLDSLAAEASS